MCAGKHARWLYHTPKQLVDVDGEPLLIRTLRMLDNNAIVVTLSKIIARHVRNYCDVLVPKESESILHSILSTVDTWDSDVSTFYLGDVYFTNQCMYTIKALYTDSIKFVGNKREIFGMQLHRSVLPTLNAVCNLMSDPKLWNLYYYQVYRATVLDSHIEPDNSDMFTLVSDNTCDFDIYSDYANFMRDRNVNSEQV